MINKNKIKRLLVASVTLGLVACGDSEDSPPTPVAESFNLSLLEDSSTSSTLVVKSDSDSAFIYQLATEPLNGMVTLEGPVFTYRPFADFNGKDKFTYQVNQNGQTSNLATVNIDVTPINDSPVASSESVSLDEDESIQLRLAFSDIDSEILTIEVLKDVDHGKIIIGDGNSIEYRPKGNFNGEDTFVYRVYDGELNSASATLTITVRPVNDKPSAQSQQLEVTAGENLFVAMNALDVDNDSLTFKIVSPFVKALIQEDPNADGEFTLTAPYGAYGNDSAEFIASDSVLDSDRATLSLKILTPNTEASSEHLKFDASGAVSIFDIGPTQNDKTLVLGRVQGAFDHQGTDKTATDKKGTDKNNETKGYIALVDAELAPESFRYFGGEDIPWTQALLTSSTNSTYALGISEDFHAHFIGLNDELAITVDQRIELPFAINRTHKSFALIPLQDKGFYILGNDNQVTWIDHTGALISTKAITNPISEQIQGYTVFDSQVIEDELWITGGIHSCSDNAEDCFLGIGNLSFLLKMDFSGNPISMQQVATDYPADLLILNADTLLMTKNSDLIYFDAALQEKARRQLNENGLSHRNRLAKINNNEFIWALVNEPQSATTFLRLSSTNELTWQTSVPMQIEGSVWPKNLIADTYGNAYFRFIDRYNNNDNTEYFGSLNTISVDYSGKWQWSEKDEPSDLAASSQHQSRVIFTDNNKILSFADDNINAGGPDADAFLLNTEIKTVAKK